MNLSSNSTRPSRLVDYFLVVGANESKPFYDGRYILKGPRLSDLEFLPTILDRFPLRDHKDMKPPIQGEPFFPLGLNMRKSCKREEFFYFVHTDEHRTQSYGFCLVFYQKVQDSLIDGVIKALQMVYSTVHDAASNTARFRDSASSAFGSDDIDSSVNKRHVTDCIDRLKKYRNPMDSSRPKLTKQKASRLNGIDSPPPSPIILNSSLRPTDVNSYYIPQCICIMTRWPFFMQFRQLLKNIFSQVSSPGKFALPIERWVQCICSFNSFPPSLGGFSEELVEQIVVMDISKQDARGHGAIHIGEAAMMPENEISRHPFSDRQVPFLCPPANEPLGWKFLPFRPVLDALSYRSIMIIYECMLVERKILFISSQLSLLCTAGDFFTSLLYPLEWHHTYVPILPAEVLLALESPGPFMAGIHTSNIKSCSSSSLVKENNDDDDTVVLVSSCLQTIDERIDFEYDPLRDKTAIVDAQIAEMINSRRRSQVHDGLPAVFNDVTTVVGADQELSPDVVQVYLDHEMIVIRCSDEETWAKRKKRQFPLPLAKLDSFVKSAVSPTYSVLKGLMPDVNSNSILPDMPEQLARHLEYRLAAILGNRSSLKLEWRSKSLNLLDAVFPTPEGNAVVEAKLSRPTSTKSFFRSMIEPADSSINTNSGFHFRYHVTQIAQRLTESSNNLMEEATIVKGIGQVIDKARSFSHAGQPSMSPISQSAVEAAAVCPSLSVPQSDGWDLGLDYLGLSHDVWLHISQEFVVFLSRLLSYCRKFNKTQTKDGGTMSVRYDLEGFIATVPTALVPFWRNFSQSQAFAIYVETYQQKLFKLPSDRFAKTSAKDFWYLEAEMLRISDIRLGSEYDIAPDSLLQGILMDVQPNSTSDKSQRKISMRMFASPSGDDELDRATQLFFREQQGQQQIGREDRDMISKDESVRVCVSKEIMKGGVPAYEFLYKGVPKLRATLFFQQGITRSISVSANDVDLSGSSIRQLALDSIDATAKGSTCIYTTYLLLLCGNFVRQAEERMKRIHELKEKGENEKANDLIEENTDKCALAMDSVIEIVKRMKLRLIIGNKLVFYLLVQTCLRLQREVVCLTLLKIFFDRFTSWGPWGLDHQSLAGFDVCVRKYGNEQECKKLETVVRNIWFLTRRCEATRFSQSFDEATSDMDDLFTLPRSPIPFSQQRISIALKSPSSRANSGVADLPESLKVDMLRSLSDDSIPSLASSSRDRLLSAGSCDGPSLGMPRLQLDMKNEKPFAPNSNAVKETMESSQPVAIDADDDDDDDWDYVGRSSIYGVGPAIDVDAGSRQASSDGPLPSLDTFVYSTHDADNFHILVEEGMRALSYIFQDISVQVDDNPKWQINSDNADCFRPPGLNVCKTCNRRWRVRNIVRGWNRHRLAERISYYVHTPENVDYGGLIRSASLFECFPKHCSASSSPNIYISVSVNSTSSTQSTTIGPDSETTISSAGSSSVCKKSVTLPLYSPWDLCGDILGLLNNESYPSLTWTNLSMAFSSPSFRSKGDRFAGLYWSLLYWLWVFELPIGFLLSNTPSTEANRDLMEGN